MNVFDFDNTIYDGESTFDFYLFCVKHHPKALKFVFIVTWSLIKYKLCLVSEEQLMKLADKYVCSFLQCCPDAKELAQKFWDRNFHKIKKFYFDKKQPDDVVVSASFDFLLKPVTQRLGIANLLCSKVDLDEKKVIYLCYRKNKKDIFKQNFDENAVLDVYTDSLNDKALMSLAKRDVYLVKGGKFEKFTEQDVIL